MSGGGITLPLFAKIIIILLTLGLLGFGIYLIILAFPFSNVFWSILKILGGLLLSIISAIILILVIVAKSD